MARGKDLNEAQAAMLKRIAAAGPTGLTVGVKEFATRQALMNRMLIEWVERDKDSLAVRIPTHLHLWKGVAFLDGCHWFRNGYECECGAQMATFGERQPPSPMMDGDCDRCQALMKGKPRTKFHTEVFGAVTTDQEETNAAGDAESEVHP